jgi:hypothetical protein
MTNEKSKEQDDKGVILYKILGEDRALKSDMTVISRRVDDLETVGPQKKRKGQQSLT